MSSTTPRGKRGRLNAGAQIQRGAMYITAGLVGAAVVVSVLLMFSTGTSTWAKGVGVGVTLFLLSGAAAAVGAALGFLFGLPRSRFTDELAGGTAGPSGAAPKPPSTHYLGNSNLIKVSDWLTTIVIGLGLVNLANVVPAMRSLASALGEPLGGAAYSGALGVSACVVGVIGGFLVAYLFTVVRVRQLLEESEVQDEEVPILESLPLPSAQAVMSSKRLKLAVGTASGAGDVVVHQDPPPGSTVPVGSPVTVNLGTPGQNGVPAVPSQTGESHAESSRHAPGQAPPTT